jgi:hypothetical protein
MKAAEMIPWLTGVLIFISILIANQNDPRKRRARGYWG